MMLDRIRFFIYLKNSTGSSKRAKTIKPQQRHLSEGLRMEFERRKAVAMAAISDPNPDKSPKGNLDVPIIPLLDAINLHPSLFTTSSCSGRISILQHPNNNEENDGSDKESTKRKKKKAGGGGWILVSHDKVDPESVVKLLFKEAGGDSGGEKHSRGLLVFRFEPLIIAVECRDMEAAQLLVSTAISSGFRESGITSLHKRIMIAIRCSIRLEVPLGQIDKMMISPDYIRYLVGIANEKMEANRKRTDSFFQAFQQQSPQKSITAEVNDIESNGNNIADKRIP